MLRASSLLILLFITYCATCAPVKRDASPKSKRKKKGKKTKNPIDETPPDPLDESQKEGYEWDGADISQPKECHEYEQIFDGCLSMSKC